MAHTVFIAEDHVAYHSGYTDQQTGHYDLCVEVLEWLDDQKWYRNRDWMFSCTISMDDHIFMMDFNDPQKALMFKLAWGGK